MPSRLTYGQPSTQLTLLPATTVTASGASGPFPVGEFSTLLLALSVTAVSGSSPTLNLLVDTSPDGGVTWFQLGQLGPANIAAVPAGPAPAAYLLSLADAATAFGETLRLRWTLGGSSPSFTFAVLGVGK